MKKNTHQFHLDGKQMNKCVLCNRLLFFCCCHLFCFVSLPRTWTSHFPTFIWFSLAKSINTFFVRRCELRPNSLTKHAQTNLTWWLKWYNNKNTLFSLNLNEKTSFCDGFCAIRRKQLLLEVFFGAFFRKFFSSNGGFFPGGFLLTV